MAVSSSYLQIVRDVDLEAVELLDGVVKGLFGVAERAASSPGGRGLGLDHQTEGGVGSAPGGHDTTGNIGAGGTKNYKIVTEMATCQNTVCVCI